jgi:hypothetical protein
MTGLLLRKAAAEFVGTALLVAAVIGSGIMGEQLAGGNVAVALLANTIATGAALVALILTFGSISGAHLNPAVSVMDALERGLPWGEVPFYLAAQFTGGLAGVLIVIGCLARRSFHCPITPVQVERKSSVSLSQRLDCSQSYGAVPNFGLLVSRLLLGATSQPRIGLPHQPLSQIRL